MAHIFTPRARRGCEFGVSLRNAFMTKSKTAILWGPDDLLAQAMEFFLTAEDTWEVVRVPVEQGADGLREQVRKIGPDLTILYSASCLNKAILPLQLIQDRPNLKVVTLSLEDNQMDVYSKQSIRVRKVSDLLSIIGNRHFSDDPIQTGGEEREEK